MSQDPNAHLDQTVLEMIEHSPIGAVPHTPAFQDALTRLRAAHKVYPNADHKDCFVTARSLAGAPSFHAENLDALIAGKIEAWELEPDSKVFDRYVQSLPAPLRPRAEAHRLPVAGRPALHRAKMGNKVFHDPTHILFLVPGSGPHPGLPGNYLHGSVFQVSADAAGGTWSVHIHDGGDGVIVCGSPTLVEALGKVREALESAPFHMSELEAFGFRFG